MPEEPTQKQDAAEMQTLLQSREVTLAGQQRSFSIKSIKDTHEFRRRVGELMGSLVTPLFDTWSASDGKLENADLRVIFQQALPILLADGVDSLIDMLWVYAPELKEFEADATDDEILDAALEVLEIAFPLVLKIGKRIVALLSRAGINLK